MAYNNTNLTAHPHLSLDRAAGRRSLIKTRGHGRFIL